MRLDLDSLRFTRVSARPTGFFAIFEVPPKTKPTQYWDISSGDRVVAHAEIFEGPDQWGVRLFDQVPEADDAALVRIAGHLLVWHAGCRAETVDVVLARTKASQLLVRVGGEYV